jgi:hypothetical protein
MSGGIPSGSGGYFLEGHAGLFLRMKKIPYFFTRKNLTEKFSRKQFLKPDFLLLKIFTSIAAPPSNPPESGPVKPFFPRTRAAL